LDVAFVKSLEVGLVGILGMERMGILGVWLIGYRKGHMTGLGVVDFMGIEASWVSFVVKRRRFVIIVSLLIPGVVLHAFTTSNQNTYRM
jgi:hypothetical protein